MDGNPPDAILMVSDPLMILNRARVFNYAAAHRLPVIYENDPYVRAGGLMSYGADLDESLVQDAAHGTLLREPRRTLHARIAETLESQFTEIAESQPELLARHCTEAGLVEKAAGLWGKAVSGRWSARHWSKPQSSSRVRLGRSRPCPPRPRCAASRSSFRSPS